MKSMTLFTIGYEGASIEGFWQTLRENRVELLLDVRATAWSRKAGFSKAALQLAAEKNGLQYEHWVSMGCPREILTAYRANKDWDAYTRDFWKYLRTREDEVRALAQVARVYRCALLCFEADADFCHRSYVAQFVEEVAPDIQTVRLSAHQKRVSQTNPVALVAL